MGIYRTVKIEGTGEYEEKRSRFIATVRHTETEEEVTQFLSEMRKKYYDASHNCYAYSLGKNAETVKCSDDKEPQGTAGRPILAVLEGAGVTDACIVVTRYFGGTLLGTGGLVRSYTKAAQEGLKGSVIAENYMAELLTVTLDYSLFGSFKIFTENEGLAPGNIEYADKVTVLLPVPEEKASETVLKITDLTQGKAIIGRNEKHIWLEKTSEISLL